MGDRVKSLVSESRDSVFFLGCVEVVLSVGGYSDDRKVLTRPKTHHSCVCGKLSPKDLAKCSTTGPP